MKMHLGLYIKKTYNPNSDYTPVIVAYNIGAIVILTCHQLQLCEP